MAPSSLAQWFGAAGTIAAVVVALFRDFLLGWLGRPRLKASCGAELPWTVKVDMVVETTQGPPNRWAGKCYFVRTWVVNDGKTRAEKVQVYAAKLAKLSLDGKYADIPEFSSLNLKWSNFPSVEPVIFLDGLSPKMGALCDVVSLCHPSNPMVVRPSGSQAGETVAELQLEVPTESRLLAPGKYKLTLKIAAANVEPVDKTLYFEHKGRWLDDDTSMRRDCLTVSME